MIYTYGTCMLENTCKIRITGVQYMHMYMLYFELYMYMLYFELYMYMLYFELYMYMYSVCKTQSSLTHAHAFTEAKHVMYNFTERPHSTLGALPFMHAHITHTYVQCHPCLCKIFYKYNVQCTCTFHEQVSTEVTIYIIYLFLGGSYSF